MRKLLAIVAICALLSGCAHRAKMDNMPECVTEDSVSCVWHANRHGNGQGLSFYTDADGNPTYIN